MRMLIYLFLICFLCSCKSNADLSMERGIQYYGWEMIEKAVLEFKYVIHNLTNQYNTLEYDKIQLLSRAHHNLAIAYAKKKWYKDAAVEARKAFELFPTDDNRQVLDLIKEKKTNNTNPSP